MQFSIQDGRIIIDMMDLISSMDEGEKKEYLDRFIWEEVIDTVKDQLTGNTSFWGWDTSGWRHGEELRAKILEIQGIEPEFKKDLESKIKSAKSEAENYKQYYDWYFKFHHSKYNENTNVKHAIEKEIGTPTK